MRCPVLRPISGGYSDIPDGIVHHIWHTAIAPTTSSRVSPLGVNSLAHAVCWVRQQQHISFTNVFAAYRCGSCRSTPQTSNECAEDRLHRCKGGDRERSQENKKRRSKTLQ